MLYQDEVLIVGSTEGTETSLLLDRCLGAAITSNHIPSSMKLYRLEMAVKTSATRYYLALACEF